MAGVSVGEGFIDLNKQKGRNSIMETHKQNPEIKQLW